MLLSKHKYSKSPSQRHKLQLNSWHRAWLLGLVYQIFVEWINNLNTIYICFIFWHGKCLGLHNYFHSLTVAGRGCELRIWCILLWASNSRGTWREVSRFLVLQLQTHLLPMKAKYNSAEHRRQTFYIQEIRVLHYVMNWGI